MDFIVAMITDNNDEKPVMSVHNAASWGYFDTVSQTVTTFCFITCFKILQLNILIMF